MTLEVYDPAMCCSSGVCGAEVDPERVRFSTLVDKLKRQGVEVQRYSLTHEPMVFAQRDVIRQALAEDNKCLPIVLWDGVVVSRGEYPADTTVLEWVEKGASHV